MPTTNKKVSLIQSTFYKEFDTKIKLNNFIFNQNILSMNSKCLEFEKRFSYWQGRKQSILVNSGSSANLALIQALLNLGYLKRGDRVGFSALTWATNVMPLIQFGLTPVPVDVEIETLNISTDKLKEAGQLKALFITNLLGMCGDLDKIKTYCEEHDTILLEDNCESIGSVYKGVKLGNFGLASTFSFYVGHQMSTIEGGMVCTDDEQLADMLKMVRAHGWKRDVGGYNDDFYGRYTFYDLGFNLRPTEITGFLGLIQLDYLDEIVKTRQDNFNYISEVYKQEELYPYNSSLMTIFSSFCIPVVAKSVEIRDELLKQAENKLETRPIVGGNITEQPFFNKYAPKTKMTNASLIHKQGFYVANNPDLRLDELALIKETLCLKK